MTNVKTNYLYLTLNIYICFTMFKRKNLTIRFIENIHVGLWLCKDMFWMLELKSLGTIMIVPTVLAAIVVLFKSRETNELWVNISVLCWILANSIWMLADFYTINKLFSLPFFIIGIISFIYYLSTYNFKMD